MEKEQTGQEVIKSLHKLVEKKEKEKNIVVEELEEKEKLIHELKMKVGNDCVCQKYNKSIDEIYQAGSKHRQKALDLKDIAQKQKMKIAKLQEEKTIVMDQLELLKYDFETKSGAIKVLVEKRDNLKQGLFDKILENDVKADIIRESDGKMQKLKIESDFLKKTLETSLRQLHETKLNSDAKMESLQNEIQTVRKQGNEQPEEKLEHVVEREVHEEMIREFDMKIEYYRDRERDLEQELSLKYEEIDALKECQEKIKMKSSSSSLAEELKLAANTSEDQEKLVKILKKRKLLLKR